MSQTLTNLEKAKSEQVRYRNEDCDAFIVQKTGLSGRPRNVSLNLWPNVAVVINRSIKQGYSVNAIFKIKLKNKA